MSRPLLKHTTTTGFATLLSRITGLLRDSFIAQAIGVGAVSDAFLVAFKIPNFLRRLFAEGAFSQSFVPVISEYKTQRGQADVRELVAGVSGTLGGVLFLVSLVGVIAAPLIIYLFAVQWGVTGGSQFDMAVQMLRWTFPYLFFISLVSLFSGVLNSYGSFFIPAFTQVIMNLVMIVAAVVFATHSQNPGLVLAIGVFVSGLLQLLFQLPAVARLGLLALPRWRPALEGVRRVAKLMVPGIVGSSMAQISLLLDTQIATALATGSVSWLYYADRLMEFPLGVFSIALATVILPGLSAHHASKSAAQFSGTLDWALRLVLLLASPAAVGMLCFAAPMTAMIFGYRQFSPDDVLMTSYALMAYSWGLLGFSFVKVLVPGYYARQNTRRPVRIAMTALGITMGINLLIVLPAAKLGFPNPHILVATATCIGAAINTLLLWRGLTREGVLVHSPGWTAFILRVLLANLLMGAMLWWLAGDAAHWVTMPFVERIVRGGGYILLGAIVYFAVLFASGMRYRHLRSAAI
ncbi:MAG: murein biosynthesis integral membrane protein MurJ [Proteobacteria bacterium]|jgi:putative peptidoglycan lipid II flippase|nr:murein biosynthesis integral membrane protein MurJ [Pseudomonadota bacterium]MCC6632590.1 murein biosynthesis integral membrane protein MurJ [Gammaproteobacteria bacterium]